MASAPKGKATGIDISQYQVGNPWNKSDSFVIVRLTSGDGGLHVDSRAKAHIEALKKSKTPFAVYHFLGHAGGAAEARYAVKAMEDLGIWGHKLVCDFEGTAVVGDARDFIREAKRLLRPSLRQFWGRKRVGLYSGNRIKESGGGTLGADFGWLADYTAYDRPSGWSRSFTMLWQYTSLTAARGHLDLDAFMPVGSRKRVARFFQPIDRRGYRVK